MVVKKRVGREKKLNLKSNTPVVNNGRARVRRYEPCQKPIPLLVTSWFITRDHQPVPSRYVKVVSTLKRS